MERRLGRGLGSLLARSALSPTDGELPIDRIQPNPHQPREVFDNAGMEELTASITQHGVLQPIVVRHGPPDASGPRYELVSGERRLRASSLAGKKTIPAVIRSQVGDDEMLELALVENLQRRDLDPMERARGFQEMLESLRLTQEEVAQRVGLKRSSVANHLRLLDLPEIVQDALQTGKLTMGHARALLGIPDESGRCALMKRIMLEDLSVRHAETLVREAKSPPSTHESTASGASESVSGSDARAAEEPEPWVREFEARLRESLGTKVRVVNGKDYRGQITIEYFDLAGLDRIIEQIAPQVTL